MTEQAATNAQPKFEIQRVYLKDMSLEQPNSPGILFTPENPQVDIQIALNAEQAGEGIYEVTLGVQVTASSPDEFGKFVRGEVERWSKVVRENNIKAGQ